MSTTDPHSESNVVLMDMPDLSPMMAKAYGRFVALVLAQPYSYLEWAEQSSKKMFEAWVSQQVELGCWLYYHEKEQTKRLAGAS